MVTGWRGHRAARLGGHQIMIGAFVQCGSKRRNAAPVGYMICESGCWEWVGHLNHAGYGRLWRNGKQRFAHRVMWQEANGPISDGLQIDHLCRNPKCVRVDHLEVVTPATNVMRSNNPCAGNARKTHCCNGHEFAGSNLYLHPDGSRVCRRCAADAQSRYRRNQGSDA